MKKPADYTLARIRLEDVYVVGGRRPVNTDAVAQIAQSFEQIGQVTPIAVRIVEHVEDPVHGTIDGAAVLVAGNHRLEAARSLGWTDIACIYMDGDEIDARLWEISENLHRAELTALERDEQIAEWVDLIRKKVSQLATPSGGTQPALKGLRAAERELGIKKDDASRATKVASLTPEAKQAARDAGLDDNRSALLSAARAEPEKQAAVIRQIAERKVVIAADPLAGPEALEKQVARLMSAWNSASPEAREEFLGRIETPVFERGAA